MIEFEVPGVPVGNARPRVTRFGTYTPEKTRKYKELIRKTYEKEAGQFIEGFVGMDIMAYFPIPKSYTKKQRKEIEEHHFWYGKKPDKDNIDKSVMDALNGIAYKDDSMVVMGRTLKKYCRDDEEPKIVVRLKNMEESTYEQWGSGPESESELPCYHCDEYPCHRGPCERLTAWVLRRDRTPDGSPGIGGCD